MQATLPNSPAAASSALTQLIEQTLLIGKQAELDTLVAHCGGLGLEDKLRRGLEALRYFRNFYALDAIDLPFEQRQTIIRYDAEWTVELLKQLHTNQLGSMAANA